VECRRFPAARYNPVLVTAPVSAELPPGLTAAEAAAIRSAVGEAEGQTGGEIVALALASADEYQVAYWKGAALAGLAAATAAALADQVRPLWITRPAWTLLYVGCGLLAGAMAARYLLPFRRWLCGPALLERRLQQRAREAFLVHSVFTTRDRTGILVAVSSFERRVVVLADEGIHSVVPAGTWENLASETAATVRTSGPGAGLLQAVRKAGDLLQHHGLSRRPDDHNELADDVRGEFL
jgi:putative membrane protein